jgi:hypothetical protein
MQIMEPLTMQFIAASCNFVRFQVLTAASMKIRAFWGTAPYSLGVDRRFIALMMEKLRTSETSVCY